MRVFLCILLSLICFGQVAQARRCSPTGICTACSNCSACKHCNSGGSCSVCRGGSSQSPVVLSPRIIDRTSSAPNYTSRPRSSTTYSSPSTAYYPRSNNSTVYYPPQPRPTPTPKPRPQRVKQDITVPSQFTARVVGVHDGDTITVLYFERYKFRVRLYGIDAPENSQPFGQTAKSKLSELVYGKEVKIYSKGKDKYGRLLGWVFRGETCINKELVLTGHAWWYRQAANESGLRDAERLARQRKVGLWATKNPVAPWSWKKR